MTPTAVIELSQDGQTLHCAGEWTLSGIQCLPSHCADLLTSANLQRIDASQITDLDTIGAVRLHQLITLAEQTGKKITLEKLSKKHHDFLALIETSFKRLHSKPLESPRHPSGLALLGCWAVRKYNNACAFLIFLGEITVKICKIRTHGVENLWKTGLKIIQTAGCQALPIIAMMSFLIGIVLAYQLGVQLKIYGADIYVVDASGIAILREFAPLMTSVLIAGRTSTAFAALIGTMKVNDELDALSTMGISAIERIVLPRILGLIIVLPLLVVWASLFSVLGSMITVKAQLHIGYYTFLNRFASEVGLKEYVLGIIKTPIFAIIIATVGCFQGFRAEITADSVGLRTTAAAVQAIFLIIVADAFFSVLFSWRAL